MKNQKNKSFEDLLSFDNEDAQIKHDSLMISLQFVSEINKVLQDRGINKKELADDVSVSPSYITQIFSGNKTAGYEILAKIQKRLGIRYQIYAIAEELAAHGEIQEDHRWGELQINIFLNKFKCNRGAIIYKGDVWTGKKYNSPNNNTYTISLSDDINSKALAI